MAKHVQQLEKYKATLHRSSYEEYKGNARSHLKKHGIYDDTGMIEDALRARIQALASKRKPPMSVDEYVTTGGKGGKAFKVWGGTRYTLAQVANRWTLDYSRTIGGKRVKNFGTQSPAIAAVQVHRNVRAKLLAERGYEALVAQGKKTEAAAVKKQVEQEAKEAKEAYQQSLRDKFGHLIGEAGFPYYHQAHHVLPVEVFNNEKWGENIDDQTIATYLDILLQTEYDINDPNNILYLPHIIADNWNSNGWMLSVHDLPNHAKNHDRYNEMASKKCKRIYDEIKRIKAVACEDDPERPKLLAKLKEMLIRVQLDLWAELVYAGPNPMPS